MRDWDWAKIVEWAGAVAIVVFFVCMVGQVIHAQNKCEDSGGRYIARAYECVYEREAPK